MATKQKHFEAENQRAATENDLHNLAQTFSFPVPNLEGDASLVDGFLAAAGIELHKKSDALIHKLRLLHVGPPLLHLVIIREYLHRLPENDYDIFELVKQHRISRVWTPHEQALAACHGEANTLPNSPLAHPPTPTLYGISVKNDCELAISDDEPLIAIQSAESVNWTSRPGLSGGVLAPRHYRPPHLRLAPTGPRPKPRPAHKKAVRFQDEPAVAGSSGVSLMSEEEWVVGGGDDISGASAKRSQGAGENGEELTHLRRSKRARTALQG
jgi:hypothetical protein